MLKIRDSFLYKVRKSVLIHNVNKEIMFTIEGKDARKAL